MRKMDFLIIVFVLVLGILTSVNTQNSFSEESSKNTKIKDFQTEDLRKREINTADLRGKIIIIGFSTQETSDYMIDWQTEVGYETGITLDGYDEISIISVADVSSFSWVETSVGITDTSFVYCCNSSETLSSLSLDLDTSTNFAPSFAKSIADALPMPPDAPVITTTLSSNLCLLILLTSFYLSVYAHIVLNFFMLLFAVWEADL